MKKLVLVMVLVLSALIVNAQRTTVKVSDLPKGVADSIQKEYSGYTIKESARNVENNTTTYEVLVTKGAEQKTLHFDNTGKSLKSEGGSWDMDKKDKSKTPGTDNKDKSKTPGNDMDKSTSPGSTTPSSTTPSSTSPSSTPSSSPSSTPSSNPSSTPSSNPSSTPSSSPSSSPSSTPSDGSAPSDATSPR